MTNHFEFLSKISNEAKEDQIKFLKMDNNTKLKFIITATEKIKYIYMMNCALLVM